MAACKRYIASIFDNENIGDSLIKLNNNFANLKTALCDLHERVDSTVVVRTFFYYGPNSINDGMNETVASYPSINTIENFANGSLLNIKSMSRTKDIVYVIYQKTGYLRQDATRITSGTVTVQPPPNTTVTDQDGQPVVTTWNGAQTVTWTTSTPERSTYYSPTFIIWKLVFDGSLYKAVSGFPKFSRAHTASTSNWNNPQTWGTY